MILIWNCGPTSSWEVLRLKYKFHWISIMIVIGFYLDSIKIWIGNYGPTSSYEVIIFS